MPRLGETIRAKELGYVSRATYLWTACVICRGERWVLIHKERPRYALCKSCCRKGNRRNWGGGRNHKGGGYWQVRVYPDSPFYSMANKKGYVLEHRLVMAQHLNRPLMAHETVHHRGDDKSNNNITNLQLRLGAHGKGRCLVCGDCGSVNIKEVNL